MKILLGLAVSALALFLAAGNHINIQAAPPPLSLSSSPGEVWTKVIPNAGHSLKSVQVRDQVRDFVDASITEATMLFTVCPNNSADFSSVWLPWRNSVMNYWVGTPQTNRVSLTRFYPITVGDWAYLAVNPSATVPMELGVLSLTTNPQRGNRIAVTVKLVGGPFTLAGTTLTLSSSDGGTLNYTLNASAYSQEYVGRNSQGNAITSGAATQTSYGLETTGPAVGYGASTQADLDQIRDWIAANNSATAPFMLTAVLDVSDTTGRHIVHLTRRLPFLGNAARVAINRSGVVEITGVDSQMYQLEGTAGLAVNNTSSSVWTPLGPPLVSGSTKSIVGGFSVYYRARQGQ